MSDDAYIEWIREGLEKPGKSQVGLANALGVKQPQISRILSGDRRIKLHELPTIAVYLESAAPLREHSTVPLVGYVGAGSVAHFYAEAQGPFDRVPAPQGATDDTVAVEIKGSAPRHATSSRAGCRP